MVCRVPHAPLQVHLVPPALQDHHLLARAYPLPSLVLQIVATGLLPLCSSLVSSANLQWVPCPQAPLLQDMALPLVPHHLNRALHPQDPSLLVLQAPLGPRWLWPHLHTCQAPHQVDHLLHLTSILRSFPHPATTACPRTTAEGPLDQTTHTDARHHMKEGTMVLEAGKKISG